MIFQVFWTLVIASVVCRCMASHAARTANVWQRLGHEDNWPLVAAYGAFLLTAFAAVVTLLLIIWGVR